MEQLIETYSEGALLMASGAIVGLVFGLAAYHSRFCLRAATAELWGRSIGPRFAIWIVAFSAAVLAVQTSVVGGLLNTDEARQIASPGSLSGAIIGGIMFGVGMTLARGCASRLLVLSASGNLRAIVTGLVLTLTAQASLRGVLAPAREALAGLWVVPGGPARDILASVGLTHGAAAGLAALGLAGGVVLGLRSRLPRLELLAAAVVGFAVCGGWVLTYAISQASFDIVAIESITFTGPSTDTLMSLVNERGLTYGFGVGLVPGVFVGALVGALLRGEARIQRFEPDTPMERYLAGGILMGFGSMLAGGCAVGAGMSGGAIFALTAWVALFFMWVGAMAAQWALALRPIAATS